MPKFFTREICGDTIKICGPDAKHLIKVLRKRPGDGIMVCDGDGFDYHAVIESADGETVITRITGREENRCEPAVRVTVYQAVPKGSKMETVVQKCTELGAFAFVPFTSEYSVVRDDARGYAKKRERWQKTADEAVKQCMRGRIPQVAPVLDFQKMLKTAAAHQLCLMAYELCEERTLKAALTDAAEGDFVQNGETGPSAADGPDGLFDIGLIIGSEGGFSTAEADAAEAEGILTVSLGRRILRTETAGAAALACIMYHLDQM